MPALFNIEDGAANLLATVEAEHSFDALSVYSEREGFARYDSLDADGVLALPQGAYILPNGRPGGVFTNYEIQAYPANAEGRKADESEAYRLARARYGYLNVYSGDWGLKASAEDALLGVMSYASDALIGVEGGKGIAYIRASEGLSAVADWIGEEGCEWEADDDLMREILKRVDEVLQADEEGEVFAALDEAHAADPLGIPEAEVVAVEGTEVKVERNLDGTISRCTVPDAIDEAKALGIDVDESVADADFVRFVVDDVMALPEAQREAAVAHVNEGNDVASFRPLTEVAVGVTCASCAEGRLARGDATRIAYCEFCGDEVHPGDANYPTEWREVR